MNRQDSSKKPCEPGGKVQDSFFSAVPSLNRQDSSKTFCELGERVVEYSFVPVSSESLVQVSVKPGHPFQASE